MTIVHPNLFFFGYLVVVAGLCPVFKQLANHFSR